MSRPSTKIQDLFREAARHLRTEFQEIKGTNPLPGERGGEAEDVPEGFSTTTCRSASLPTLASSSTTKAV
jgi:hypothetical protein